MIQQFQVQQLVKDFCGLTHLLFIVGQAGDELKVPVDDPANSGDAADSQQIPSLGPLSQEVCASCCMFSSSDLKGNGIFDFLNPVLIPPSLTVDS